MPGWQSQVCFRRLFVRVATNIVFISIAIVSVHIVMVAISRGLLDTLRMPDDKQSVKTPIELLRNLYDNKYADLVSNRSNVSSDERHVIYVFGDEMTTTLELFFKHFLLFHPQVIYMGSLTRLKENWVSDDITYYMDVFINRLHTCHYDILPEFVHYANDMLIRTSRAPWCINRKPRSKSPLKDLFIKEGYLPVRNRLNYCIPPSSRIFKKICRSHHLAVYVNKDYTFLLEEQDKMPNTKSLVFIMGNGTGESYCDVFEENVTSGNRKRHMSHGLSQDTFVIKISMDFSIKTLYYCLLELCNYLDIYFNITHVKDITKVFFA